MKISLYLYYDCLCLSDDTRDFLSLSYILHPSLTWGRTLKELGSALLKEIPRYISLHKRLFGTGYIPYLPPRPSERVLRELRGSFSDFLRRNNLPLFETLAYSMMTRPGYGQPHRFAAIYGLMLITPQFAENVLTKGSSLSTFIDGGFLAVLDTLVRRFDLNVKLNVNIRQIVRYPYHNNPDGDVQIIYRTGSNPNTYMKSYDFLVVAVPMSKLSGVIDTSPVERAIFGKLFTDTFYVSTLCDSAYGHREKTPMVVHADKILKYDYEAYLETDEFAAFNNISGREYQMGLTRGGIDGANFQTTLYLQLGRVNPWIPRVARDIDRKLYRYMRSKRRVPYRIVRRLKTPYFTRFPISAINQGILWDVFDLQGHRNTWYIGGSVTVDAAGIVIQYNERILRHYIPPVVRP